MNAVTPTVAAEGANPRVHLGANNPPADAPDPFAAFSVHIEDLMETARGFLDGEPIDSEALATKVSQLLDECRTAGKDADKARAEEKKPHDEAAKAVQAKWKPLIDRAALAADACKKALAPWLAKKEAEARAAAEKARQEAEAKAAEAAAAMRAADSTDLAAREEAEAKVQEARRAEAAANKAEKVRSVATGGARATTLRTSYRPELTNAADALRHYVKARPEEIKACLLRLAEVDVRNGARSLPGFTIHATQQVV